MWTVGFHNIFSMRTLIYLSVILLSAPILVRAQDHAHTDHEHSHSRNEVAVSNNLVFLGMDQELAYGVHLHYLRSIRETRFGTGLGYERIFDEHGHNTINVTGSYSLFHELVLMMSPGITFDDHSNGNIDFSIHLEAGYEFEINHLHLGPVLGFAFIPGDYHISLGLHLGYDF